MTEANVYVNDLSKVALDSADAGIEHTISNRISNALTTAPLNLKKEVLNTKKVQRDY